MRKLIGQPRRIILFLLLIVIGVTFVVAQNGGNLVATNRDVLINDGDGDGGASSGDTIRYEIVIANCGPDDAENVQFSDTPDSNTQLIPNSVTVGGLEPADSQYCGGDQDDDDQGDDDDDDQGGRRNRNARARDDALNVTNGGSNNINVTDNDRGRGLQVVSFGDSVATVGTFSADGVTVGSFPAPGGGTIDVTIDAVGNLTATANGTTGTGTVTIFYEIQAANGSTDTAQVTITFGDFPVAVDDTLATLGTGNEYSTNVGVTLNIGAGTGLLNNDTLGNPAATLTDWGGGDASNNVNRNPGTSRPFAGGTLTVNADGSFDLVNPTIPGTFTFDYIIDNGLGSSQATVEIFVEDPPVAQDDTITALLAQVNTYPAPTLFNDNGNGADNLGAPPATITFFGGGSFGGAVTDNAVGATVAIPVIGGTLTVNADGSFVVDTPTSTGTFTFQYRLDNGVGTSDATVTVNVVATPVTQDDLFTIILPNNLSGDLTADNGSGADDPGVPPFTSLTFGGGDLGGTVTDNAGGTSVALAGGTLTVNNNGTMTLNGATVPGTFTFDYQLTNANGVSNISTVTIEVRALPIAQPDALTAIVNIVNNFAAPTLFNDNGSGADTLGSPTATLVSFGGGSLGGAVTDNAAGTTVVAAFAGGDLTVNADGSLTVSNPTTTGVFTFDYRIQNVAGFSDATVTVTINQAPIAQDDAYTFLFNVDQNVAAGAGLFVDNGSGADNLGNPVATLTSFGGGDLGGAVTDNIAGASVALAGGTLTVNADGSWSLTGQPFTPSTFTFDYRLTNAFGTSDATVTLVIQDPPIAFDDTGYTVAVGNTLNVAAGAGVFVDNGFGADNLGTPTATLVSFGGGSMGGAVTDNAAGATVTGGLAGGDITVNADGSFTLANPTTAGTFTFQYRIQNISGFSDATVTIIITQAPDGFDDTDATVLGGTSSPGSNNFHLAVNTSSNGIVNVYVDNGFGADILGGPSAPTDPPADDINNVLLNGVPDPGTGTIGGGAFAIGGTGSIEITTAGDINITPPTNFVGLIEFDYILANSIGVDPTPATVTFAFGQRATCLDDPNYTATSNIEITINAAGGVLANDVGNGIVIEQLQGAAFIAPSTTAATTNGSVTLNADGSFTYEPNAGFVGMDTFTYTINNIFNTPQTCTATIDVTAPMGMIPWFIDNSAAGANLGTFNDPFTSIAAFNAVNNTGVTSPNDDDVIYIFRSTGYNEADGINLDDGQKLFGGGVQFDTVFTADANSSAAYQTFASTAAGANTLIESTGGNGIDLANTNIVEGINIGNTPAGAGINGNGFGTLTLGQVSTVNITGTGQIVNLVTGTLNSTFNSLTTTARPTGTDGIFMNGVSGNLTATTTSVSGGDQHGIQVINSPAGGGTFNFGNTTITTNGSGDNGILLNNNNAAQTIQTTNGTINSTGGEAINATNSNVNMALTNVTSTNSNDDGIDLDGVSGSLTITGLVTVDTPVGVLNSNGITIGTSSATVTINSVDIDNAPSNGVILDNNTGTIDINGGNIDGAALIGVSVLGGTANFSYSGNIGTIVPNTGPAVAIANVTGGAITFDTGTINSTTAVTAGIVSSLNTGGTTNFDGPVTLNTTGAALGVSISNNAGHTTSFTNNTLTITTNNATGFFATNAGTVNTTAGTISTGTGIGVDIDNTTLGMTLTSVTTNGAVNGINLDTTTGSFNVAGDGTMTQNDSGGVILNPTSHGVVLNNATNVTLQSMRIDGINTAGTHGISSTGGQNFVFKGLVVQNINGGLNVVRSSGWRGTDLGGVNQVVDSLFQNFGAAADAAIDLQNTTVGMTSLLIDNSTFQNQNDANGKSVVFIRSLGGINMGTVTVEDSLFTNLRGIGLQTAAEGTSTLVSVLQRNTFRDAVTTGLGGINGLVTSASNSGNHTITIDSNDFDDVQIAAGNAGSLVVTAFDTSTLNATINNNRFIDLDTDGNVVTDAQAIRVVSEQTGGGPVNVTISNNTLNNIGRQAIFISTRNQAPDVDINISNNIIGNLVPVGFTNRDAISISAEDDSNLDVLLTGNNVTSNTTTQEVLNIFTDRVTGGNTPVLNATIDNSSGTGNTFTNSNGGGADNVVIETLDVAETICVNMSGNTIAGVNTIDLTHSGGTFNVTQASEAAMEAANGGANVIPTGTVTFNQPACALPTIP